MLRSVLAVLAVLLPLTAQAQTVQHPFTFTRLPTPLPDLRHAVARWADVDGDGDLDLFATGTFIQALASPPPPEFTAGLYRNDGPRPDPSVPGSQNVTFTLLQTSFTPVAFADAAWGDYDLDGDLDLVVTGSTTRERPYRASTTLYRNDGEGAFTPVDAGLQALHSGAAAWADHDGDGDLDLLLTGTPDAEAPYTPRTVLYRNNGGVFSATAATLPAVMFGDVAWEDVTGDGRPDVALAGLTEQGLVTQVYVQRDGAYALERQGAGVAFGDVAWSRSEVEPQLLITGGRPSKLGMTGTARRWTLSGTRPLPSTFPRVLGGETTWGDLDGDGDEDLIVAGSENAVRGHTTRVYEREGDTFVERSLLYGMLQGTLSLGDYDADGDLDLLAAGLRDAVRGFTSLYRNERALRPSSPQAPSQLSSLVDAEGVTLTWMADGPATYDVWIGSRPDLADVRAPAARLSDGQRLLVAPGSAGREALRVVLPAGTYFWGVQQVSTEFAGSAFAAGRPFEVGVSTSAGPPEASPLSLTLSPPKPNPSRGRVTFDVSVPENQHVRVALYDALGRQVLVLHDAPLPAGRHPFSWNGTTSSGPLGAGVYFCRVETATAQQTRSFTLFF